MSGSREARGRPEGAALAAAPPLPMLAAAPPLPMLADATAGDLAEVEALVAGAGLTLAGLDACVRAGTVVVCREQHGRLVGTAATERYGRVAFLRSVAVDAAARGNGLGRALVERALADARAAGAHEAWLLTETSEPFFAALGWARADRGDAPHAVAASVEFASACPTSAVAMRHSL